LSGQDIERVLAPRRIEWSCQSGTLVDRGERALSIEIEIEIEIGLENES